MRDRPTPPWRANLEPLHRPPLLQMFGDDFVDVFFIDVAVPYALGIDHHHRAFFTAIETPGRVDAAPARPREPEFFYIALRIVAPRGGAAVLAALPAFYAHIGAEEHELAVIQR